MSKEMPAPALYDVLHSFTDIHKVVLNLAGDLSDEQLNRKPNGYREEIDNVIASVAKQSPVS